MRVATLTLALVLAVAAGCGGDSEDSTERPATGGQASDYRRALTRLCREDKRLADRLARQLTGPEELGPYFRKTLAYSRKRRPLYEALKPPSNLRDEHARSIELGRRIESQFAALVGRVDAGADPIRELQNALPRLVDGIEEGNRLARRIGAKQCVVEVPAPGVAPQEQTS